jgi:hypothetical protein
MNRGERRNINEKKWVSKVKKLWNSWGKKLGFFRSERDFETVQEFEKSSVAKHYKHTSTPYKKRRHKYHKKRKE